METILDFCGHAEQVVSTVSRTKVINPALMTNPDGSKSDTYNTYVNYLQSIVDQKRAESGSVREIQEAERRLNGFKGKSVEFMVGGVTASDRENLKAAVEDAVFNCKSASKNGVGYGANYMAFMAVKESLDSLGSEDDTNVEYLRILYLAYCDLLRILYDIKSEDEFDTLIEDFDMQGCPKNIRSGEYDHKVLSSIKSDVIILDTISHILMNMYTCNQYLTQTVNHNIYIAEDRD
jgi:hypothetical protein